MTLAVSFHVLLVEDDDDTRDVLRLILESTGIRVTAAHDGLDALERIEELRKDDPRAPYAIVLDYMMPRFSGAQFRERQLANPAIAEVPVIFVSAVAELPQRVDGLKPFAVLQKPIEPDALVGIVRDACENYLKRLAR